MKGNVEVDEEFENPPVKRKKRFSFKRLFAYMGVYVLLSFCFGFVIVLTTHPTASQQVKKLPNDDTSASAFGCVINDLMGLKNFNTDLDIALSTDGVDVKLAGTASIILYEGYSGAEVRADLSAMFNGEQYDVSATYKNDQLYLKVNDNAYSMSTSSLVSGVTTILGTFGVDLDINKLMSNFDMSILNDLEENMTEESFDDYKVLTLSLSGISVNIKTTPEYKVQEISLPNFSFSGVNLDLCVGLKDVNTGVTVTVPKGDEFVDITEIGALSSALASTMEGNFQIEANIVSGENTYTGTLVVDRSTDIAISVETSLFNKTIGAAYKDGYAYLTMDGIKLMTSINDVKEYFNLVKNLIPGLGAISVDKIDLQQIKSIAKDILDIKKVERVGEVITIQVGTREINITLADGKFSSISFEIQNTKINLAFKYDERKVVITSEEYTNVNNIVSNLKPMLNLLEYDGYEGQIFVDYDGLTLSANYCINKNLSMSLSTEIMGIKIDATIIDKTIYLDVNNIKIRASFYEIKDLINLILNSEKDKLFNNLPNIQIEEILKNEKLIQELSVLANGIRLKSFDVIFDLITNESQTELKISHEKITARATISGNAGNDISAPQGEYVDAKNVQILAENIIELVNSNCQFAIEFSYMEFVVSGYVAYDNGLVAELEANIKNRLISVKLLNNIVYINADGLKLKCNLKDVGEIIEFINKEFNLNIDISTVNTDEFNLNNIFEKIKLNKEKIANIIEKIIINYNKNELNINFEDLIIKIDINNNKFNKINASYKINDEELKISLMPCVKQSVNIGEENYISVKDLLPVARALKNTISAKNISGDLTLKFNMSGEENILNMSYGVNFENDKISAYIQTEFKGLSVNVYYTDDIIYLDIAGLKLHLQFAEISDLLAWINQNFGTNFNLDSEVKLDDLHLDFIKGASFENGSLNAEFSFGMIAVQFGEKIESVNFAGDKFEVKINCKAFDEVALNFNKDEFAHYTKFTKLADNVIETIKEKKFNLTASAEVFNESGKRFDVSVDLIMDFSTENVRIYGNAILTGESTISFSLYYQDQTFYVNYKNLKLCASKNSIKEIITIVLSAVGIDPSAIPGFDAVSDDLDIDLDNIKNIVPNIDFGNPLNMLKYLNSISIDGDIFTIFFNGKIISEKASDNMKAELNVSGESLNKIKLYDIYTGVSKDERFNLLIEKNDFVNVPYLENKTGYIDISNCSQILKSLVNTSNLNDYSITGTIKINAEVIGIPITMDVPISVKIKLIDGKPVAYILLSDIPVIGSNVPGFTGINVNNDVPYKAGDTTIESRKLEAYYADGYIYFHRVDKVKQTVFSSRTYERKLKISSQEFFSDPMNYAFSYGFGFSDKIMAEIQTAFEKSKNRENPIDISNVLLGYIKDAEKHQIIINLAEIANNNQLDKATINLFTINNASTNNKDYINKITFNIHMPIASAFTLDIATNNLSLVDIGAPLDLGNALSFIGSYPYGEDQKYECIGGNWGLASQKTYTMSFSSSYGTVPANIVACANSHIAIPSIPSFVQDDGVTKVSYDFIGWFMDNEFNTQFTSDLMPRGDITLYAKWSIITGYYRTISFDSNGGEEVSDIKALEGSYINLPTFDIRKETEENVTTTFKFLGWFTPNGTLFTRQDMPTENIKLTAKWEVVSVEKTALFSLYDESKLIYSDRVKVGSILKVPTHASINGDTVFFLEQEYVTPYIFGSEMQDADLVVYIRNKYQVIVKSAYGDFVGEKTLEFWQGETISYPEQRAYIKDDNSERLIEYTFGGYKCDGKTLLVMPNRNIEVVADWAVRERKYFVITFDTRWYIPLGWTSEGILCRAPETPAPKTVLQGDTLDLSYYVVSTERRYTKISKAYTWYSKSWGTSQFSDLSTAKGVTRLENIQNNYTLYACWEK